MHILLHILHIEKNTYSAYFAYCFTYHAYNMTYCFAYYLAYFFAYFFAYFAYYLSCIFYIFYIFTYFAYYTYIYQESSLDTYCLPVYCHYCLLSNVMAQLFTSHHLHPSPLLWDLSQAAPGKSADSICEVGGAYICKI